MPQTDSMVPGGGGGPNQSEPYGVAQQFAAAQHAIASVGANPMARGPMPQGAPQAPGPGGPPVGIPAGGPPGPTQPPPQLDGSSGQLNPQAIFSPQIAQRLNPAPPYRQWLIQAADNHPDSGSFLRRLADQVRDQKGPMEQP